MMNVITVAATRPSMPFVALGFGGIAKGWTVDVTIQLVTELLPWVLIEAGGDLRVGGETAVRGVDIAIEDPYGPDGELLRLRLLRDRSPPRR
jgi:Membrane-associated lipoprotein involved in thiamine biosynthesis